MESSVSEQKCVNCGAPLRFDPETGRSVCDWCGSVFEIPEGSFEPIPVDERPGSLEAEELPIYLCNSCGAEVVADAVSASLNCPYCGNNIVLTDKVSGGLKPDGVIPFAIDKKSLPAAVQSFYKGKKLLPFGFFKESNIVDVAGVYVPFWLYDCYLDGTATFEGHTTTSTREGNYVTTETSYYELVRGVNVDFKDIPVDGSARLEDALMDSLEPFDLNGIKPFRADYLAGFFAERFDKGSEEVRKRAEDRMVTSAMSVLRSEAGKGYSGITELSRDIEAHPTATRYVLLPVYTFNVSHKGQKYSFAMNGQTGKVVGHIPTDNGVKALRNFGIFAAVFAILMLIISLVSC